MINWTRAIATLFFMLACIISAAGADHDVKGGKDHPLLSQTGRT